MRHLEEGAPETKGINWYCPSNPESIVTLKDNASFQQHSPLLTTHHHKSLVHTCASFFSMTVQKLQVSLLHPKQLFLPQRLKVSFLPPPFSSNTYTVNLRNSSISHSFSQWNMCEALSVYKSLWYNCRALWWARGGASSKGNSPQERR